MKFQTEVVRVKFDRYAFRKEFGAIVRHHRQERNLNQADVADIIGRSRTSYINMEQGRQAIALEHLVKIALVFKVEISELVPKLNP